MDKRINDFMFWCNKVLPTAYDNSLSYYEVLCKTIEFLKYVLEKYDDLNDEIQDAVNEWIAEHPEAVTTVEDGSLTTEKFVTYLQDKIDKFNSYPCVADMVADTELVEGAIVHTGSYYADANSGGAWYVISAYGTTNDIDIIALENGYKAHLIANPKLVYLSQFGCHNTLEDNSARINRAFEYVEQYGTVIHDCGTLTCNYPIELDTTFVTFKGCGTSYLVTNVNGVAFKVYAQGCIIEGISLKNGLNVTSRPVLDGTIAIEVVNRAEGEWYNCDFEIRDSYIIFYSTGIRVYGKNCKVHECVLSNLAKGVINYGEYNNEATPMHRGLIVKNNVFHGGEATLIQNASDISTYPCYGVSFIGATREVVVANNCFDSSYCGYMYKGSGSGVTIKDNICEGWTAYCGIALIQNKGNSDTYTGLVISGNRITLGHRINNTRQYLPVVKPIYITDCANAIVENNALNYQMTVVALKGNCNPTIIRNNFALLERLDDNSGFINIESGTTDANSLRLCGNYFTCRGDLPTDGLDLIRNEGGGTATVGNSNYTDCNMFSARVRLPE